MTDTKTTDARQQQQNATAYLGSMLVSGVEPALKAQASLLTGFQSAMTDWIQRRQETLVETQKLVARLGASTTPAELMSAQQEWVTSAFNAFAADAAALQAGAMTLVDQAQGWGRHSAELAQKVAPQTAEISRAMTKSFRPAA
jgi:hypothetical protein